ncbi:unnamed protein product [Dibothriocephalus latus]|uniref:Uncharacterized protein n=1 Tax=Dibothriocephalus latus TaxID=60516 RepID=A0A3P7NMM1_DIBLA|nr:unnamed protein product [Dibothriocephalus latus]
MAIAMLKQLPEYKYARIIRTRDIENWTLAISSLMWAIFSMRPLIVSTIISRNSLYPFSYLSTHLFFRSFNLTIKNFHPNLEPAVKLSSAGLIYAHFGKRVITEISGKLNSDEDLEVVFKQLYKDFISEVDAIDNGVPISDAPINYRIATGITARVSGLNAAWNKEESRMVSSIRNFKKKYALIFYHDHYIRSPLVT